jgi:hypothetical protein
MSGENRNLSGKNPNWDHFFYSGHHIQTVQEPSIECMECFVLLPTEIVER